jgi:hypothetical protein
MTEILKKFWAISLHKDSLQILQDSWHMSPSQQRTSQMPPTSLCVCVYIPLSLLSNDSVRTLPRQRLHAQKYKNCLTRRFHAIRVVSREVGDQFFSEFTFINIINLNTSRSPKWFLPIRYPR